MLHNLFITTENGITIYAKHFIKSHIDNQLISGFLNALGTFAIEALGSEMQSLKLQTGEQLAILRFTQGPIPLIGIVIADGKDNEVLIRNILQKILTEFCTIFHKDLHANHVSDISQFREFSFTVDVILQNRVSSRTNLKLFFGVVVGLLVIGTITLALIPAIFQLENFNPSDYGMADIIFSDGFDPPDLQALQTITVTIIGVLVIALCIVFLVPTVVAGYIAGNRKRGIWAAILLGLSLGVIILIAGPFIREFAEVNAFLWYLAFLPLLLFLALVFGYYGGRLKERRKLYPLPESPTSFLL